MNKKELKKQYAQTVQSMGVYQVRNIANGKIFIDSGQNVQGKINSCKFQLSNGSHMNKALQEDFNRIGLSIVSENVTLKGSKLVSENVTFKAKK